MPRFELPGVLLLLLTLPLLRRRHGGPSPALRLPRVVTPAELPRSAKQRWAWLPARLRLAAIALLICALAGPRLSGRRVREMSRSIGIQVVVDCSGSMSEKDMLYGGQRRARIDLVRELSKEFVLGNGADLKGRGEDAVGVVGFGEYPVTMCPLMLPDGNMRQVLDGIKVFAGLGAQGTAIGDAVAVAAARFHQAETTAGEQFRSKAIVLLTDGENNSGKHSVAQAAALARDWGVRIYAIGIRPAGDNSPNHDDPAWRELNLMASASHGLARLVTDGSSLQEVYREIDKLERSDREQARYTGGWELIYALAGAALLAFIAEITLAQTWLRRIP